MNYANCFSGGPIREDERYSRLSSGTVATHTRADVVAAGKLKSTDGVYGIRFAHNTDATVTDFKKTKAQ